MKYDVRDTIDPKSMCKTCARPDVDCPVFSPGNNVNHCTQYRHDPSAVKEPPESSTETLVKAMRLLSAGIESEDGVANAAVAEAANRLEAQAARIKELERRVIDLDQKLHARPGKL
jgi:hypothetical protein